MKIGLFLASQASRDEPVTARLVELDRQAQMAEDLGFHSIFLGHHYVASSQFFQPIATAAYLAGRTQRITLGFGVLLAPLWHPVVLAEELATLDVLSGGRLVVGVGAGYRRVEYEALGLDYASRQRRMIDGIDIMRRLWRGDKVEYDNEFGRATGLRLHLRPVQPEGPPVWIGAFGPQAIARAAAHGLAWLVSPEGTIEVLEERFAAYRTALAAGGHGLTRPYPMSREAAVAATRAEAADAVRPFLESQYQGYRQWDQVRDLPIDEVIARHALVGTPDDVIARLIEYRDRLGVTEVIMRVEWMGMDPGVARRTIEMLGRHVIPALSGGQHP